MFQRSWVQIPGPYTGWTLFKFVCCQNCNVCLKKTKINEKEAGDGPFLKKAGSKCLKSLKFESDLPRSFVEIVNRQNFEAGGRDHHLGLVNFSPLKMAGN